jgi:hypothetical protein
MILSLCIILLHLFDFQNAINLHATLDRSEETLQTTPRNQADYIQGLNTPLVPEFYVFLNLVLQFYLVS